MPTRLGLAVLAIAGTVRAIDAKPGPPSPPTGRRGFLFRLRKGQRMGHVQLALTLHNHQPVGNFDEVFQSAFDQSYQPFLQVANDYPEIPITLHTSGSLLEWLEQHQPAYIQHLQHLVAREQIEILGGGFYEPILPMIPARDRVGQIVGYREHLTHLFGKAPRGLWLAERVWEQSLTSDLAQAGVEYTLLDDYHFQKAGLDSNNLAGYYLTEDQGHTLKVIPGSETLRYQIPFHDPHDVLNHLRWRAEQHDHVLAVFADDGEKFGSWPETFKHVYQDGWLRRFFDLLMQNRDWLQVVTLGQAIDSRPPQDTVYLPDASYREMTQWALSTPRQARYQQLWNDLEHHPQRDDIRSFFQAGHWRNFKVKYPETRLMYARMVSVSDRLENITRRDKLALGHADIFQARQALYRAQCNCGYWHGSFGGLYLPHLRHAVFGHLIEAESALLRYERDAHEPFLTVQTHDWNLDGHDEIKLDTNHLAVVMNPRQGGVIEQWDVRAAKLNIAAGLNRRPEPYHDALRDPNQHDQLRVKQENLHEFLCYDSYPRKILVDHVLETTCPVEEFRYRADQAEHGDFRQGQYIAEVKTTDQFAQIALRRDGQAFGRPLSVSKTVQIAQGGDCVHVNYHVSQLPPDRDLRWAVELNIAGFPPGADDRYFRDAEGKKINPLHQGLKVSNINAMALVDDWQQLEAEFSFSQPTGLWAFPLETVSQSEDGVERVPQSVCVLAYWDIPAGTGDWRCSLDLALVPVKQPPASLSGQADQQDAEKSRRRENLPGRPARASVE